MFLVFSTVPNVIVVVVSPDSSIRTRERSWNSHAPRQMILLRYLMNCDVLHQLMDKIVMMFSDNNFVPRQSEPGSDV
jgi:hypothetical protein